MFRVRLHGVELGIGATFGPTPKFTKITRRDEMLIIYCTGIRADELQRY